MIENKPLCLQSTRTRCKTPHTTISYFENSSSLIEGSSSILLDKANTLNKISVPIKQYSNKFFREEQTKTTQPSKKICTQRKFNLLLKKKQILTKHSSKNIAQQQPQMWEDREEYQRKPVDNAASTLLAVSSYSKGRKRIRTQWVNAKQNPEESIIVDIQNQLLLTSNIFTSLINDSSQVFHKKQQDVLSSKLKSQSISLQKQNNKKLNQKISQSRGLQLYSKIFVRNKSQIIQKIKNEGKSYLKREEPSAKYQEKSNNFQTRRIFPIQKNKKGGIINRQTCKQYFGNKLGRNYKTIESDTDEHFQLKGWDTSF